MSTINLMYNTSKPDIHFVVSAGQAINITQPGIYNIVPIDLENLIAGMNVNITTPSEQINLLNNIQSVNPSNNHFVEDYGNDIKGGDLENVDEQYDDGSYNNSWDNTETSTEEYTHSKNSVLDMCRDMKTDNRPLKLDISNKATLFTDNLANILFASRVK